MIVFQIHIADFVFHRVDAKGQPSVARDAQAPRPLAISRECMDLPRGQRAKFPGCLHVIEESKHFTKLVNGVRRNALRVVLRVELPKSFMDKVS